jgi:hypothetical protein
MTKEISQARHPAITAASILCFIHSVGWPISLVSPIVYMIRNRALQVRTFGGSQIRGLAGPFEALGMDTMILLALFFIVINLLYILAGYWLWKSHRKGGILAISLLALSAVFWWGFSLPIPPIVGLLLAGLLAVGWKSLRAGT